jgi:hypothetical protein
VTRPARSRLVPTAALALSCVSATVLACSGGSKGSYANEGDTGAAAPATQQTLSPNPSMGDSTVGMSRGTGEANAAGDTAGAFGKAAGAHGAVPGRPTSGNSPDSGLAAQRGAPQSSTPATPNTTKAQRP